MKNKLLFYSSALLFTVTAGAQSTPKISQTQSTQFFDVMATGGSLLSNVVIDSQVTTARLGQPTLIRMHLGCYATNLRSIGNPVAANSIVTAYIDAYDQAGVVKPLRVQFPAEFLKPAPTRILTQAQSDSLVVVDPTGLNAKVSSYDNIIQLAVPNMKEMTVTSDGEITNVTEKNLIVAGIRFGQAASPNTALYGSYFGSTGPLSSSLKWYTSADGKIVDVYANFPGAASPGMRARYQGETRTGFCGGYYSPLMMFFDESLPNFTATSHFSLSKSQAGKIYWPEANSSGYFLVLDKKNNSKIEDGEQLFGDNDKFENGFKNLASHDSNNDGVIDKKDKVFKNLKLWNDKNADGISQKSELKTLTGMGVVSITLKYESETQKFGDRAEYKQKSSFEFKKGGKSIKGTVLDLWFSPAPL